MSVSIAGKHRDFAARLADAESSGVPVAPVRVQAPEFGIRDAYAVQFAGRDLRVGGGARLVGRKVGLTSRAMQEMLGVDQPDFGYLTDRMEIVDGGRLSCRDLIEPRVEPEIAFRLRSPLAGASVTVDDVLAATVEVASALEVIDSRIADWDIQLVDTVADNASCGRFVIGTWRPIDGLDLAALEGRMTVQREDGSADEAGGLGAAVLGHPAEALAWLARALEELSGEQLAPGEVVLPGAVSRALPLGPGDQVTAEFEGLGRVSLSTHPGDAA